MSSGDGVRKRLGTRKNTLYTTWGCYEEVARNSCQVHARNHARETMAQRPQGQHAPWSRYSKQLGRFERVLAPFRARGAQHTAPVTLDERCQQYLQYIHARRTLYSATAADVWLVYSLKLEPVFQQKMRKPSVNNGGQLGQHAEGEVNNGLLV